MDTMSPSSSSRSAQNEDSSFDGFFMEQSMFLSDSLKDLKNLRSQLYSAAEYFELSYTNDDKKQIVESSLKDYAVKAIVNTVDHLGSVANKVNGLLDDNAHEVSGTELRVSCIEQRIRTCQEHTDREGRSQQSLVIAAPKYHKRYILPGAFMPDSGGQATTECQESKLYHADSESQDFQTALRSKTRDRPPSSRKKHVSPSSQRARSSSPSRRARSTSPAPRHGNLFAKDRRVSFPNPSSPFSPSGKISVTDRRTVSPHPNSPFAQPGKLAATDKRALSPVPSSNIFARSGSFSCKPTVPNSTRRRFPSELQNSASMHLHAERYDDKGTEQNTRKSRSFFKALLAKRKPKRDEMLYTYLDEY